MTGKWSLKGGSIQNNSANEWLFAQIEENSNETAVAFISIEIVHRSEEWDYDNVSPQGFSIFFYAI